MKTVVPTGRPDATVEIAERTMPVPQPGEALVRVQAFSVNRGEIFLLEDPRPGHGPARTSPAWWYRQRPTGPDRPGRRPARGGTPRSRRMGRVRRGPAGSLAPIPGDLSDVEAAALPLAGLTALGLLRTAGNITGQRILLTGAAGGVGHYVAELAANSGAEVTAVTSSAQRGERLTSLGAASVIHDTADAVGPFDLALESIGGKNLPLALDRLAHRGNTDLVRPGKPRSGHPELLRHPRRPRVRHHSPVLLLRLRHPLRPGSGHPGPPRRGRAAAPRDRPGGRLVSYRRHAHRPLPAPHPRQRRAHDPRGAALCRPFSRPVRFSPCCSHSSHRPYLRRLR